MRVVSCKGNKRTCEISPMSETGINPETESYTFPLGTEKVKVKRSYKRKKVPITKRKTIIKTKKVKTKPKKVQKKKKIIKKNKK